MGLKKKKDGEQRDFAAMLASDGIKTLGSKLRLVAMLTWPAVMAQMSMILMEYIDAAMVGRLGAAPAASIGLVATTTWLFFGLGSAASTGFSVQLAHQIGANDNEGARATLRQAVIVVGIVGILIGVAGSAISFGLPHWLGGNADITHDATMYFLIFSIFVPFMFMSFMANAMLRSSGNMIVPGIVNVVMCFLDVVFNFFLIFPSRTISVFGAEVHVPGADLGVAGASLGSGLAFSTGALYTFYYLLKRSPRLKHAFSGADRWWSLKRATLKRALVIGWPVALERVVMCGAQILITAIVAPLGTAAIAANSFAITAESLCYTPGYGVGEAATTLVGQSLGAGRKRLAVSFGRISMTLGMLIMGLLGVVMWVFAPEMMALFTNVEEVKELGTMALRIEAWAEPMFGAAIVGYGIFVGAGYTLVPAMLNFGCIWIVRVTLCAILAPTMGLAGVWTAMAIELTVRGILFIAVFIRKSWLRHAKITPGNAHELEPSPAEEEMVM